MALQGRQLGSFVECTSLSLSLSLSLYVYVWCSRAVYELAEVYCFRGGGAEALEAATCVDP
jgi:hypothetical protein